MDEFEVVIVWADNETHRVRIARSGRERLDELIRRTYRENNGWLEVRLVDDVPAAWQLLNLRHIAVIREVRS